MTRPHATPRMNDAEAAFAAWAESNGWTVSKRGWPDFICVRGPEIMAVEVKWSDNLSPEQERACAMLATHGIPTFVWSPPGPLDRVGIEADDVAHQAYLLGLELAAARAEIKTWRERAGADRVAASSALAAVLDERDQLLSDVRFLARRASRERDRTPRLRALLRRYADSVPAVRPGLRRPALRSDLRAAEATDVA
jgi:hypothetical protein